ncbi:MAG TPA: GNAT family N-acetyltransferase [Candidatus Acidoferrales bacterium]|nr:GNAT family N-acetyltransferase [Candidatus Acidoferrales bacterium]
MVSDALLDDANARLPRGYRARVFEDADREPIVAAGNSEAHPMERESASEWRFWEQRVDDPARKRITITTAGGAIVGTASIAVGMMARPDGAQFVGLGVFKDHRRRGIGGALVDALEAEAKRRGVGRLLSGASASRPFALEFAQKRGYREIGRRIMSYRELASFEPERWQDAMTRVARENIVFRTFAEILAGKSEGEQERFWRALWEAEGPMWDDIPFSSPTPHWPYDKFRKLMVDNPQIRRDLSLVAYHGDSIVGYTSTGQSDEDGHTYMTGVAREFRGKGIARALKVDALARAKAAGLRAMKTTNDEPNKAMRGVNINLGYQPVPDHVELERRLSGVGSV